MSILSKAETLVALGIASSNVSDQDMGLAMLCRDQAESKIREFLRYGPEYTTGIIEYLPYTAPLPERDEFVGSDRYEVFAPNLVVAQSAYGIAALILRVRPVISIQEIVENPNAWLIPNPPDFVSTPALTEGRDFQVDFESPSLCRSGRVFRTSGTWSGMARSVRVTYSAGWTGAQLVAQKPAIKEAAMQTVVMNFRQFKAWMTQQGGFAGGVITSHSLEGHSYSYSEAATRAMTGFQFALPRSAMVLLETEMSYAGYLG